MKTRRLAVISLSLLGAASMAVTGCSSNGTASTTTKSTASSTANLSPKDTLTEALTQLQKTGYDFTQSEGDPTGGSGIAGPGSYDPGNKAATLVGKGSEDGIKVEVDATQIGSKTWVKLDAGAVNKQLKLPSDKWMLADPAKIDAGNSPFDFSGTSDVLDIASLMTSVSDVKRSDATTLTGTVDLTAATGDNSPDSDSLKSAGAAAKTAPFTAKLDGKGRLTDLQVDVGNKDLASEFTFSNYGSPTAITPPASSDVVPAPAALYSFLNN